jgi:hypothetical protein
MAGTHRSTAMLIIGDTGGWPVFAKFVAGVLGAG